MPGVSVYELRLTSFNFPSALPFKGSAQLHAPAAPAPLVQTIAGQGSLGRYSIEVTLAEVTSLAATAAAGA